MGLQEYPDNFVGPLPPTGYYKRDVTVTPCDESLLIRLGNPTTT